MRLFAIETTLFRTSTVGHKEFTLFKKESVIFNNATAKNNVLRVETVICLKPKCYETCINVVFSLGPAVVLNKRVVTAGLFR